MATISGDLKTKFTDDLGEPLVGGKVYTYHAGTSTPKDSYQDKEFAVVNTNPIVLDDAGSCDLYLNGLYRLRVLDKDGVFVEERDYMTQGDSTGSSITDNANNITVLQSEVQAINERSVLKLDESNFIIGHGSANSATVHDPAFRVDKLKVAKSGGTESDKLLFKTYESDTVVEDETVGEGSYIDPDMITQPLIENWRDVERAAFKGTKKDSRTNLLLKSEDSVPSNSAASKLVGKEAGDVPLVSEVPELAMGGASRYAHSTYQIFDANNLTAGVWLCNPSHVANTAPASFGYHSVYVFRPRNHGNDSTILQLAVSTGEPSVYYRAQRRSTGSWDSWGKMYSSMNTNKGTNGVLSEKSPVTHLYHDRVEHTGDEKELESIEFTKQGVGDYLLKNTTGLAQEGWYIVIPHDANGNPLVAVEYEDNDGDVNVRTYKRKFDYEQAKVVADKDNPMDIPETRWIDLRFNDDPSLYEDGATDEPIE